MKTKELKLINKMRKYNVSPSGNENVMLMAKENSTVIVGSYSIVVFEQSLSELDPTRELISFPEPADFLKEKIKEMFDDDYVAMKLPEVADIKAGIKSITNKRNERVLYCFGKDLPWCNARYLLDIVENLKPTDIYYKNTKSPIMFVTRDRYDNVVYEAFLLPVSPRVVGTNEKGYYYSSK